MVAHGVVAVSSAVQERARVRAAGMAHGTASLDATDGTLRHCLECAASFGPRPREALTLFRRRKFCSRACAHAAQRGRRWSWKFIGNRTAKDARDEAIFQAVLHRPPPGTIRPPWGHICAICKVKTTRTHPLHRKEDPDRSEAVFVM